MKNAIMLGAICLASLLPQSLTAQETYSIPFSPTKDGYGFGNSGQNIWPQSYWLKNTYQDPQYPKEFRLFAKPNSFPDWETFATAFGDEQVYWQTSPRVYKQNAVMFWRAKLEEWGGSCSGFSVSALLNYHGYPIGINKNPETPLYAVQPNDNARMVINSYSLYQFGAANAKMSQEKLATRTPNETVNEIVDIMSTDAEVSLEIGIYDQGGHSVVAYKVVRGPEVDSVFVYDNNFPGDTTRIIRVFKSENRWEYEGLTNVDAATGSDLPWGGTKGFVVEGMPIAELAQAPTLPLGVANTYTYLFNPISKEGNGVITLRGNKDPEVTFTTESVDNIDDFPSVLLPIINQNNNQELQLEGFSVPATDEDDPIIAYQSKNVDSTDNPFLLSFKDNFLAGAGWQAEQPGTAIALMHTDSLAVFIADSATAVEPEFGLVKTENIKQYILSVAPDDFNQGAILGLGFTGEESSTKLLVRSVESYAGNYSINIELEGVGTSVATEYQNIAIGNGDLHIYSIGSWDSLSAISLSIDRGGDGTIDEVIQLEDRAVGVAEFQPNIYNLSVSPNPMEQFGMITYSLPTFTRVKIELLDAFGQVIMQLKDEVQSAGKQAVQFSADNIAAGIYFARLHVDGKVITHKIIVTK